MALNLSALNLDDLTSDPIAPADGYFWHRSDIDEIRAQINGVTVTVYPATDTNSILVKSWTFTSPSGSSGIFYVGGFYDLFSGNDDFSPLINFGVVNNSYAAHFFVIVGSIPVDTVTITVIGTSITDDGVRTTSDTEDITLTTSNAVDDYVEISKKWLDQVSVETVSGTAVQCNYGYSKYWDNQNGDFTIKGFDATWNGGANDASANIEVIHHQSAGWTYNAGSTPDPPTPIVAMVTDHGTESEVQNNSPGSWKRVNLSESVSGSTDEGFILRVTTGASKSFEIGNFLLWITVP